ncbi:hypothetical protein AL482_027780 [Klebsiella pneumoniae]|uniref:DDE-type integrase/transposase/recombinase n=1 Tax=Klebsiella pneumoniae TaxID=573 RepID=UPI000B11235E|nr:DDE-type integrase/transposase/recombinase [Klebsiella pneumoniae]PNM97306.1 hypothetical protein AL482_027780 [Klebsiella pneumoniae]
MKVNGRWAYLYRAVDSRAALSIFISPPVVTAKLHTGFWVKSSQREEVADPRFINTDKAPPMVARLLCSNAKAVPSDVEHRQIKYRNNVIECDHGKLNG